MSLDSLGTELLDFILSHLLYHESTLARCYAEACPGWIKGYIVTPWTRKWHFGFCGQSCGCCRSRNREDSGPGLNCQPCYTGWILTTVSQRLKGTTRSYGLRTFNREAWVSICKCGKCFPEWFRGGWVCPVLWSSDVEAVPAQSLEWDLWTPVSASELAAGTCGGS